MFDGHAFGGLFMWLLLFVLLALVVWAVTAIAGAGRTGRRAPQTPHEILKERFARGEIDEAEYRRKRDLLDS